VQIARRGVRVLEKTRCCYHGDVSVELYSPDDDRITTCMLNSQADNMMTPLSLQPSATSPLFFDNLHFEHFDKSVNHKSTLKCLSKCSKWRLSKKRGLVADGWMTMRCTCDRIQGAARLTARLDARLTARPHDDIAIIRSITVLSACGYGAFIAIS
jgi:hypothetical protein